jgi:hypothetical protein
MSGSSYLNGKYEKRGGSCLLGVTSGFTLYRRYVNYPYTINHPRGDNRGYIAIRPPLIDSCMSLSSSIVCANLRYERRLAYALGLRSRAISLDEHRRG